MKDFKHPTMECPRCKRVYDDFDGVGVVYCEPCGFCRHVARSGDGKGNWKCDFCGEVVGR